MIFRTLIHMRRGTSGEFEQGCDHDSIREKNDSLLHLTCSRYLSALLRENGLGRNTDRDRHLARPKAVRVAYTKTIGTPGRSSSASLPQRHPFRGIINISTNTSNVTLIPRVFSAISR